MRTYSPEFKEAMLAKLLPPHNVGVPELSAETGIPKDTLYSWRSARRRAQGLAVPAAGQPAERWSSEEKFTVVVETAALTEAELGEYCRKKGRYAEQVCPRQSTTLPRWSLMMDEVSHTTFILVSERAPRALQRLFDNFRLLPVPGPDR